MPWVQLGVAPIPDALGEGSDYRSHPWKAVSKHRDDPALAAYSAGHQLSPRYIRSRTQGSSSVTQGSIADRRRDPPTTQLPLPRSKTSRACQWPPTPRPGGDHWERLPVTYGALRRPRAVWSPRTLLLHFHFTPQEGETEAEQGGRAPTPPRPRLESPAPPSPGRPTRRGEEPAGPSGQPRTHRLCRRRLPGAAPARCRHCPGPASADFCAQPFGCAARNRAARRTPSHSSLRSLSLPAPRPRGCAKPLGCAGVWAPGDPVAFPPSLASRPGTPAGGRSRLTLQGRGLNSVTCPPCGPGWCASRDAHFWTRPSGWPPTVQSRTLDLAILSTATLTLNPCHAQDRP